MVETDAAAQTLSLQVDYGDTSLQFTSDLEDAVAAVASEAEGAPGRSGGRKRRYPVFPPLDPVQTALLFQSALPPIGRRRLFAAGRASSKSDVVHTSHDRKQSGTAARRIPPARYCFFVRHSGSPRRRRSSILTYIRITCNTINCIIP